ncbi:MAG TPA: hypothetical protein PLV53_06185 [Anaerolineaceae bacterium]|jgi:hypothetical protein|nr:hypothetical protein [Anaerolineaceae bacterium]
MVEGKVAETFGPTLEKWLEQPTPGKLKRLCFLKRKLGLEFDLPGSIRYQLLPHVRPDGSGTVPRSRGGDAGAVLPHGLTLAGSLPGLPGAVRHPG